MKTTIIRALTLLLTLIPHLYATAYEYDFKSDELYYNILSEDDRTVKVTYMASSDSYNVGYVSGDIEIPRKVLYKGKTYNVTSIGGWAFRDCFRLSSVTIPPSVTSIGGATFYNCSSLSSVTIPNSVTSIEGATFYNCFRLSSVTIPNSVTSIGDEAFYDCSGLTSVTIGNSVTSIGKSAFKSCSGLTSVTIPPSVTSIGSSAFKYCSGIISVTIPPSVTSIEPNMFNGCTKLEHINVNPENINLSSIDGVVYNKDASTLLYCPEGKTAVTIPNSVTSIGSSAFHNSDLTSVTIPNSVTSIGEYAFYSCTGLISVTIPNSVTSIGSSAFSYCSSLETIYVQNQVPLECSPTFSDDVLKNAILYVPTGTLAAYEKVDPWRNFWNIEEMDFSGVEETAADGLEPQISVENGIIRIGNTEGNPLVEVFDISGKNVFRGNDTTVSGLAKGIYIVRVGSNVQKIRL